MAKVGTAVVRLGNLDTDAPIIGGQKYIGDLPPSNKKLVGIIRRMHLTTSKGNDPVIKVLYECTAGPYDKFVVWDNVTLNNAARFKWQPLIDAIGVTVDDLITTIKIVKDDDSEVGKRIVSIGKVNFFDDDPPVPVYFGVEYKRFQDVTSPVLAAVHPRVVAGTVTEADEEDEAAGDGEDYFPGE